MSYFLYVLGRACAERRWQVLGAWLAALALAGTGAALLQKGTDNTFAIPGTESQDSLDHLKHVFHEVSGTTAQIVVLVPEGQDVAQTAAPAVAGAIADITKISQVTGVLDPFDTSKPGSPKGMVSEDKRAAIVTVTFGVTAQEVTNETRDRLVAEGKRLAASIGQGASASVGGEAFGNQPPELGVTEGLGLVVALVVLGAVFRSVIAAVTPLFTGVFGVAIAISLIFAATRFVSISSTAPMLAVMLGLAVGIDYALFLLSRHRDQLGEGLEVEESVARAVATAGSAVLFAGLTVVIALLGLSVAGIAFLTVMGVAAAVGVVVAVAIAVTLIPALLSFAGERLRPKRKKTQDAPERTDDAMSQSPTGLAGLWLRVATAAPAFTVAVLVVGLAFCAVPALDLRLALPDNGTQAKGKPAREAYDVVSEHFGPGFNGPLIVTVDVITSTDPIGVTNKIADEIKQLPNVASIPLATPNPKGDTSIIEVVPGSSPDSPKTDDLVSALRGKERHFHDEYGVDVAVTGLTAVGVDVSAKLGQALVPFAVFVVGFSLVLLAMVFRSVWVPVKAAFGYLLSVAAALGATAFVFDEGHFANALGVAHVGSVISFFPIILMAVLFGLAMDYEVFLVSRIREDFAHGGEPEKAIRSGFNAAFPVVVAAALIMLGVFAAFIPEGDANIKPIAFGLAVGVFVDAFLVRLTLVPAILALLGRRAWWLPGWLDRKLPVFDVEGDGLLHELRLADWPSKGSDNAIDAQGLRALDDQGHAVYSGVGVHLKRGKILVVHGPTHAGKTALLFTFAGRVGRFAGDLKVLGRVLPQHSREVRREVAVISCRETHDPLVEVDTALAEDVELILLDDVDVVVRRESRDRLGHALSDRSTSTGKKATFVLSCQDPALVRDLLPTFRLLSVSTLELTPGHIEV